MTTKPENTTVQPPQIVDAAGAKQLIDAGRITIVDVRTKPEINEYGYLAGARFIDFRSPDFSETIHALARNDTYLIYCQSGIRGLRTGQLMEKLGFTRVYILEGGINTWLRAGLPILHDQQQ
ncbi:MAG: rhodanese-like domain-containing protein [Methanocorpusculum sp.]|nr:rhodanese-like domain-containing protein [Methanocorpusculum sp.]MDE2522548.1 rhodanese-like domain-containing protein [Methanocorpusculum sp.]MDE2524491.1 rhodanese-like domain-containing protein [Methanocorpusculum sp.]